MWNFVRHAVCPSNGTLIASPHSIAAAARCVPPMNSTTGSGPTCQMPTAAVITPYSATPTANQRAQKYPATSEKNATP